MDSGGGGDNADSEPREKRGKVPRQEAGLRGNDAINGVSTPSANHPLIEPRFYGVTQIRTTALPSIEIEVYPRGID